MPINVVVNSNITTKENNSPFSILIVDDDDRMRELIEYILKHKNYDITLADSGEEAIQACSIRFFDVVISDHMMPGIKGLDLLISLREKFPKTKRILITGYADLDTALSAINRGAVHHFLTKPFDPDILIDAVEDSLDDITLHDEKLELLKVIQSQNTKLISQNIEKENLLILTQEQNEKLETWNQSLEKEVSMRTENLKRVTEASIYSLAELAESRSPDIGGHLRRMQNLVRLIADGLKNADKSSIYFDERYITDLVLSTLLHDIGKISIPGDILFKPGKLTAEEYAVMKTHASVGENMLKRAQEHSNDKDFLAMGKAITASHHERWDGNGYPRGLKGDSIPLSARIVAIADVYDALTTARVYKAQWTHEEAMEYLEKESGKYFDPELLDICIEKEREIQSFTERGRETESG